MYYSIFIKRTGKKSTVVVFASFIKSFNNILWWRNSTENWMFNIEPRYQILVAESQVSPFHPDLTLAGNFWQNQEFYLEKLSKYLSKVFHIEYFSVKKWFWEKGATSRSCIKYINVDHQSEHSVDLKQALLFLHKFSSRFL